MEVYLKIVCIKILSLYLILSLILTKKVLVLFCGYTVTLDNDWFCKKIKKYLPYHTRSHVVLWLQKYDINMGIYSYKYCLLATDIKRWINHRFNVSCFFSFGRWSLLSTHTRSWGAVSSGRGFWQRLLVPWSLYLLCWAL